MRFIIVHENGYWVSLPPSDSEIMNKNELSELDKDNAVLKNFIDGLCRGEFILRSTVPPIEGHTQSSIYDTETFHVYFRMNNGTTVHLRLYENGYVRFQGLGDVCVQISGEAYNSLVELLSWPIIITKPQSLPGLAALLRSAIIML